MVNINSSRWVQVLVVELVIIATFFLLQIVGGFLMQFSGIGLLFFVAWLLAFALRPLIRALVHSRIPHPLAVVLVYVGLVLLFVGVALLVIPQLVNQLTALQSNWDSYIHETNQMVVQIQDWVQQNTGQHVDLNSLYQQTSAQLQAQAGTIIGSALTWLQAAASLLFNLILVILISLYIALDGDRLGNSMVNALPRTWRDEMTLLGDSIGRSFGGFLRGQLIFAAIYGILNAAIMAVFGLDYVLIASIIAGFCMLIPLLGNFLAYIPPVLVALITPDKAGEWWLVLGVMLVMQSLMMQVVGPRIMSSAVGIHPLFTVMAMLLGAQVMGIWGALFGIPVAGVIALVSSSFFGRLKTFFGDGEGAPVISMVVAPAVVAAEAPGDAALVASTPAVTSAAPLAAPTAPDLGPGRSSTVPLAPPAHPPALVRGLNWLASTAARRGAKR